MNFFADYVPLVPFCGLKSGMWRRLRLLLVGQALILVQQGVYESISPNKPNPLDTLSVHAASPAEVFAREAAHLSAFDRRIYARQQRDCSRRQISSRVAARSSATISDR